MMTGEAAHDQIKLIFKERLKNNKYYNANVFVDFLKRGLIKRLHNYRSFYLWRPDKERLTAF